MDYLKQILLQDKPSDYIRENSDKIFEMIPELKVCKGFNQNNIWHIYDVFEHILHVVDGVPKDLILRMSALFHDVGKPFVYTEDENKVGHFYFHWNKSNDIFLLFASKYNLEDSFKNMVSNLILYHDINVDKLNNDELANLLNVFDKDGIVRLFELKKSDLLAQNKKFHYLLKEYEKQKIKLLNMKK